MWIGLPGRRDRDGTAKLGRQLYDRAVAAARMPDLYEAATVAGDGRDRSGGFRVPDTLDGRFDMICLMVALLVRRLQEPAPALAQAVFDAMFRDMDASLRELGVGDLGVPRRVSSMWEAFHGRYLAYDSALRQDGPDALSQCLVRNIWRGSAVPGDAAQRLAVRIARMDRALALQPEAALRSGVVRFDIEPGATGKGTA